MPEQYLLSQKDHDALKGFIQNLMQSMVNPRNRTKDNTIDNEEWLAPEVYIALTPSNGIPALQRNTTGTGSIALSDDVPGSGLCTFYRLLINDITGDPYLDPVGDYIQIVYNITTTTINGDSWVLAIRDKAGSWIASPLGPTATSGSTIACRYIKVVDKICFVTITYNTTGSGVSGGSCIGPIDFGFALDLLDGDSPWVNPSGALTAGVDVCTYTLAAGGSSDSLVFYGSGGGASIPPTAFLTGVIIEVLISCTPATPSITLYCTLYDSGLSVTLGTSKTATPPFSAGYTVFGSASDLWGNTTFQWTTYHGCLIALTSADGSDVDISIDHVRFTLCYPQGTITIPSTGGSGSRQAIKTVYQLIDLTKSCSDPDRVVNEWCEIDEEDCCADDVTTGTGVNDRWGVGETGVIEPCTDCPMPATLTATIVAPHCPCIDGFSFPVVTGPTAGTISCVEPNLRTHYSPGCTDPFVEFFLQLCCQDTLIGWRLWGTGVALTPDGYGLNGAYSDGLQNEGGVNDVNGTRQLTLRTFTCSPFYMEWTFNNKAANYTSPEPPCGFNVSDQITIIIQG